MSSLAKRTIFGALFVVIILGSFWLHIAAFFAVLAIVVLKGSEEMCQLFAHHENSSSDRPARFLTILLFLFLANYAYFGFSAKWLYMLIVLPLLPFVIALFSKNHNFSTITSKCYASMLFVGLPCGLLMMFLSKDFPFVEYGKHLLTFVFVIIWVNDVFAYLVGSMMGRHKLFERISPNKTIEGSLGGLIFAMLTTYLVNRYCVTLMSDVQALGLGLIAVVVGSIGDLCESMLKRQAGVKDSGDVIPGHGGILDRFDATFFAIPFIFTYLMLIK